MSEPFRTAKNTKLIFVLPFGCWPCSAHSTVPKMNMKECAFHVTVNGRTNFVLCWRNISCTVNPTCPCTLRNHVAETGCCKITQSLPPSNNLHTFQTRTEPNSHQNEENEVVEAQYSQANATAFCSAEPTRIHPIHLESTF